MRTFLFAPWYLLIWGNANIHAGFQTGNLHFFWEYEFQKVVFLELDALNPLFV